MSGQDEEIGGDEPRSFGSHFSARCRWITFAFSMWGFGFLVLQKTSGLAVRLGSETIILFLLLFAAGLISLLATPPSKTCGTGPRISLAKLLFLGVAVGGLSQIFSSLDIVMARVGGSLYALPVGAAGLALLSLGLRQILVKDWRLVTRETFFASLSVFWLNAALYLALKLQTNLEMIWGMTSVKPWGRLTFLIFLDTPLEASQGQALMSVVWYLMRGPFIWLIISLIPMLLLRARYQKEINLIDLVKGNSKVFGLGLFGLGICLAYAVPVFALGVEPPNILPEEDRSWDVTTPAVVSLILTSLLLVIGMLLVVWGGKVKLALLRWPLLGLLAVLAVPSLLSVAGTLSSVRLGFHQPGPAYVLLPFSIMVMAIFLAILLFWPRSSLPSSRARQYISLLGVAILLASFVPSMAGYYRLIVKDVRVTLVELGPVGMDRRTEVIVDFTLKNRGPECHGVAVKFFVDDVPTTYPKYVYIDKLGEREEVTANMSFQIVTPKTYSMTIYLFRDVEVVEGHTKDGQYLGYKTKKIRIEGNLA